ncbi:unnamed protein product [Rhizophagus irregularis]|nr:unnamed protein product [Rhizophagus irregularis]CAB5387594.1 unnamed protein product [Rhizophagus irregularis]
MEFRRGLAFWAAFRRSRTLKCGEIGSKLANPIEIDSELANPIGKEIGSELANPIDKEIGSELANSIGKLAPIWMPESRREISSDLPSYRKIIYNFRNEWELRNLTYTGFVRKLG